MTPERLQEQADTQVLAKLFDAAAESRRSSQDLMRVILAGALPLAAAAVGIAEVSTSRMPRHRELSPLLEVLVHITQERCMGAPKAFARAFRSFRGDPGGK